MFRYESVAKHSNKYKVTCLIQFDQSGKEREANLKCAH